MRRRAAALIALVVATACGADPPPPPREPPAIAAPPAPLRPVADRLQLPRKTGSLRFAVIGDSGRGHPPQYQIAAQMLAFREVFPFDLVVMLGDNVYDGGTAEDYRQKFELPYKPLLDAGVKFYATIGNHDDPNQPAYPLLNMRGHRYYTFTPAGTLTQRLAGTDVEFFMVDTEQLTNAELGWLDREMERSSATWKIPVFHRPIYTSGRYARPGELLRRSLEPIFVRHGVKVAFSGHEHFYERTKPQNGITYFISGGAGSLRAGDIRPTGLTDKGFDADYHFMLVEIAGGELFFQAITREGETVDVGVIRN